MYAKTLDEFREKELDVLRDTLDGINVDVKKLTFKTDKDERAVNAKGKAKYAFDNEDILVQFLLDDNGSDFEVYAIEIDGTPITDDAIICLHE